MITLFHLTLGVLFVTDAMLRLWVLHRKQPLPVMTHTIYRRSMHVNVVLGICLIAAEIFS